MNLVGKIFVVLIFVMSIVFAGFTVTVYATHKNWRHALLNDDTSEGKLGAKPQLDKALDDNQRLMAQRDELEAFNKAELQAKINALSALENTNAELRKDRTDLEKQLAVSDQKATLAVAEMNLSQKSLDGLRTQNTSLRQSIMAVVAEKDSKHAKILNLTDDLHQAVMQANKLGVRNAELLEDIKNARDHIVQLGGKPGQRDLAQPPEGVEGIVTATPSREMIEISIGSDDGIAPGHQLDVKRGVASGAKYIGRVEVVSVRPDKAACKVLPKWLQEPIQRGDRVSTIKK